MFMFARPKRPNATEPSECINPFADDLDLADLQQRARLRLTDVRDRAFFEAPSNRELADERAAAERIRARHLQAREREDKETLEHEQHQRRRELGALRAHAEAVAEHHLLTSPAAQIGQLFQGLQADGRILTRLLWACVAWGAVNVQHNVMVGVPLADPRWWLAFLIEPMLTLPLIVIMRLAARASQRAHVISKKKIFPIEAALVLVTVTLNVGPHIGASDIWTLIIYSIPPLMIAAIVGLHAFASSEYATMIGDSSLAEPASTRPTDARLGLIADVA